MLKIHEGQCGLCSHYGEHAADAGQQIVQIRVQGEAPEDLLEPCGHPQHEGLDLKVSPISGCTGFEPAQAA